MMIDAILILWISLFAILLFWFFIFQPKLGSYYRVVKSKHGELVTDCRPKFIFAKHNEQLIFLIFMFKRKYENIPDKDLVLKGRKYRKYILMNSIASTFFLANTALVILIGATGNL